jgi:hypothetical protein
MADNTTVTVTDVPTILYQSNGPQQETIMIDNTGAATITLGGKSVVAGHGPSVAASAQSAAMQINEDILYAIAPSGTTATVYIAHWLSGGSN